MLFRSPEDSPQRTAILDAVLAIAKESEVSAGEVAIAWVAAKGTLPIIGPRTLEQLEENLASAKLTLTPQQIAKLDAVSAIPTIFPHKLYTAREARQLYSGGKADLIVLPLEPVA